MLLLLSMIVYLERKITKMLSSHWLDFTKTWAIMINALPTVIDYSRSTPAIIMLPICLQT
jgi:hypothetical protein